MGTPDFAAASLSALYEAGRDEIVGVFTQPDKPVGRKHKIEMSPVKRLALEHGTPVFQPVKLRDGTAMETVRSLKPDVITVVAYGRILPTEILEYPSYGAVNIHASLLPKYRGAAPIQWAVIKGERVTGVTAMYMAATLDTGDIIDSRSTEILPGETAGALFERLAPIGAELLCDVVSRLEGGVSRTPQNDAEATFAPPLTKDMGVIDWHNSARETDCLIRGLNPWPVAVGTIAERQFKIYSAHESENTGGAEAGTVLSAGKDGITVACGDGAVTVTELQASGGKRMSASDYLRGHPICP